MSAVDSTRRTEREAGKAPDAFRTISEVADELDIPQHVLRFWETRFGQIKPMKRGGGRRYYRPDDVDLLRGIRHLLYGEGYTIRGVQRLLKEKGVKFVQGVWLPGGAVGLKGAKPAEPAEEAGPTKLRVESAADEFAGEAAERREPQLERTPPIVRSLATPLPIDKSRVEPPLARPLSPPLGGGPGFAPATHAPAAAAKPPEAAPAASPAPRLDTRAALQEVLRELAECKRILEAAIRE